MSIDKIGKVTILATLGTGAHSSILRVRRDSDSREYALKLVSIDSDDDKKYLEQARHEFRIASMLNHPNLVKIYAYEEEKTWLGAVKKAKLLIEYIPGQTLDKVPLLNMAKLLRVLEKIASALVHMHKQGILHADLKPNNIMLARGTNVKIIDYGLARLKSEPKERIQGTPEYMAPETATHKLINERTDIYNFGATMYRLVTFKHPPNVIPEMPGLELKEKTFHELLKPVNELSPGVPKALADLIHRCLAFKALKRPERMSEVQSELDRLAEEAIAQLDDPDEIER